MPVYFRRSNAKISKMIGVAALFAAFMLLADGYLAPLPFLIAGGAIFLTRTAENNGGLKGTAMDLLALALVLVGYGVFAS